MKGSIAAFVVAVQRFLAQHTARTGLPISGAPDFGGSIALVITGDEEGPAINGTIKMLDWMRQNDQVLDACVVGEPTNPAQMGDMIKIGRRGSLNGWLTVEGIQGHAAYPHLADNPLPRLISLLNVLAKAKLDDGTPHFQPSTLTITDIHVGNQATNVIPARGVGRFNIRFNDLHTGASLSDWLHSTLDAADLGPFDLHIKISGESFLTPPGQLSTVVSQAVTDVTGRVPDHSTTGGTSDARFIKDMCPVVECGLINKTIHKVDEHATIEAIEQLTDVYQAVLNGYFAS